MIDEKKLADKYPLFRAYHFSRRGLIKWITGRLRARVGTGPNEQLEN
jgi:hypothetical protein